MFKIPKFFHKHRFIEYDDDLYQTEFSKMLRKKSVVTHSKNFAQDIYTYLKESEIYPNYVLFYPTNSIQPLKAGQWFEIYDQDAKYFGSKMSNGKIYQDSIKVKLELGYAMDSNPFDVNLYLFKKSNVIMEENYNSPLSTREIRRVTLDKEQSDMIKALFAKNVSRRGYEPDKLLQLK